MEAATAGRYHKPGTSGWQWPLDKRVVVGHNRGVKKKRKSPAATADALRAQLAARFPWVALGASPSPSTASSGLPAVDALTGGLPRGRLIEICGQRCSGRTSLMLKMLAAAMGRGEACALVDASDAFDPESGCAAGVDLERLLWVRCARFEQAFRSAEWLLCGGGFGLLALDLSQVPPAQLQHVPLNVWFRLRRAVEHTPTVLVVLEQRALAGSSSSFVMEVEAAGAGWSTAQSRLGPAHAHLLSEKHMSAEVVRRRSAYPAPPLFEAERVPHFSRDTGGHLESEILNLRFPGGEQCQDRPLSF
jgi:hypothetical protein